MASAVISSVPTTASRFALLQVDSGSDSDSEPVKGQLSQTGGKSRSSGAAGAKSNTNEKKKEKRRKKKEQQQSEANELRNLAFKKIPQKCSQGVQGQPHEQVFPNVARKEPQEDWQQWQQKDEQLTSNMYEADLEKALMMSKLEFEKHKEQDSIESSQSKAVNKKEKRRNQGKDKAPTVALKDFQSESNIDPVLKNQEELKSLHQLLPEGEFFNRLEDDVSKILIQEKKRRELTNVNGVESRVSHEYSPERFLKDGKTEQLKEELEKKTGEMKRLKKVVTQWEVKYKEVKARNAQLLKMLQEGEMKDKADILLQVDELLTIKNELTLQVTGLHVALEQERSKVKGLQSELLKYQGGKKGKRNTEAENCR